MPEDSHQYKGQKKPRSAEGLEERLSGILVLDEKRSESHVRRGILGIGVAVERHYTAPSISRLETNSFYPSNPVLTFQLALLYHFRISTFSNDISSSYRTIQPLLPIVMLEP
ncbi:hypothetical protein LOAG_05164 [Loa loa]|uniref:Uncharacterized protein n=1 Tax=Loa loa TaxID=7209 RepID=A0A1S0U0B7_LOALO|nr:hypothetical protein LOAG_05164 [Loa loa]EFO23326.1 hypothetical protein LOAG_05164 [Loa loa]